MFSRVSDAARAAGATPIIEAMADWLLENMSSPPLAWTDLKAVASRKLLALRQNDAALLWQKNIHSAAKETIN